MELYTTIFMSDARMYVRTYVCIYTCMRVYMYVYKYVVCLVMYVCMCVYLIGCVYCMYVCTYLAVVRMAFQAVLQVAQRMTYAERCWKELNSLLAKPSTVILPYIHTYIHIHTLTYLLVLASVSNYAHTAHTYIHSSNTKSPSLL